MGSCTTALFVLHVAAHCSAVLLRWSFAATLAPFSSSSRTTASCPLAAARSSAVNTEPSFFFQTHIRDGFLRRRDDRCVVLSEKQGALCQHSPTLLELGHKDFLAAVPNGLVSIAAFVQARIKPPPTHHLGCSPSAQAPSLLYSDNLIM